MRLIASLLLMNSAVAAAADFRVATNGQSCSDLPKLERLAASTSLPAAVPDGQFQRLLFEVEVLDRRATLVYLCKDGLLLTENYSFPLEDLGGALSTFSQAHLLLIARFGSDFLESKSIPPETLPFVAWRTQSAWVTLNIVDNSSNVGARYRSFLVISSAGHTRAAGSN